MRTAKLLILGLCIFCSSLCAAQIVLLPSWVVDSLIYEARYSRQCRHTVDTLQSEIKSLGSELLQVNARLDLSKKEVKTLEGLLENSKAKNQVDAQQFNLDKDKLKRKLRKRNMIIFIESIGIGLLLLL